MGYRIQYGYRSGDVYRHLQTVTMVSQGPNQPKLSGKTELETVTRVLTEQDGVLTVRLEVRALKREGMADLGIQADLSGQITCTMDRSGVVLSCDNPNMPKIDAFPPQDVEVGMAWQTSGASGPGPQMAVRHMLETVNGDRAQIVSEGSSAHQGIQTTLNAAQVFDLTRGLQIESTSVVKMTFSDGRVTDVVVENRLTD